MHYAKQHQLKARKMTQDMQLVELPSRIKSQTFILLKKEKMYDTKYAREGKDFGW